MVYLRALMRGSEGEYDVCGFSRMRSQAGVRSKIDKDLQLEHPKLYLKLPMSGLGANSVSQQSMLWSWAPSGMMLGSRLPQIWRLSKARGTVCDSMQRLPCSEPSTCVESQRRDSLRVYRTLWFWQGPVVERALRLRSQTSVCLTILTIPGRSTTLKSKAPGIP